MQVIPAPLENVMVILLHTAGSVSNLVFYAQSAIRVLQGEGRERRPVQN